MNSSNQRYAINYRTQKRGMVGGAKKAKSDESVSSSSGGKFKAEIRLTQLYKSGGELIKDRLNKEEYFNSWDAAEDWLKETTKSKILKELMKEQAEKNNHSNAKEFELVFLTTTIKSVREKEKNTANSSESSDSD